ncbi:hypothetical protein E2C01_061225 [Portunus trituberculatus]|uniref:Uncharacterized protein n=1 Tax=Portunus trituberculatus TaxID=210409 RepID=A0A5B7H3A4_PORTR|nr:hypothetical protein [Portunus trituberculatus]
MGLAGSGGFIKKEVRNTSGFSERHYSKAARLKAAGGGRNAACTLTGGWQCSSATPRSLAAHTAPIVTAAALCGATLPLPTTLNALPHFKG